MTTKKGAERLKKLSQKNRCLTDSGTTNKIMVRYRLTSLPASTSTYIQRFEVDPEVLDNASNDEYKPYAARPRRFG